ncbi:protein takeout [Chrysoperla carnea]|uniref:protein takeout n=1 Tax=Chrysoperla carnea TaxID=189513 RepID=UPI001D05C5E4|nr:protein takeout [Chrysoperla carnea]
MIYPIFKQVHLLLVVFVSTTLAFDQPYFVQHCYKADPHVNECLKDSGNLLAEYFRRGIPELGVTEAEPILIDDIGISLGNGPDGYRASFHNIEAYGVSNLTVTNVRSDLDTYQYQISFYIPRITAKAKYKSSGVLILVKASGSGDYWGEYEGVKVKIYFKAQPHKIQGDTYLSLEQMKLDFSVKNIKMGVENVHDGNTVLQAALNLFINTNAQDLLKEMKPDLKKKLVAIMSNFIQNLFAYIPYEAWVS